MTEVCHSFVTQFEFIRIYHSTSLCSSFFKTTTAVFFYSVLQFNLADTVRYSSLTDFCYGVTTPSLKSEGPAF